MSITSIGDLTTSLLLRQRNAGLRADMARISEELVSGRVASVAGRVQGNFRAVTGIEQSLARLATHDLIARETASTAGAMQTVLDAIGGIAGDEAADLLLMSVSASEFQIGNTGEKAAAAFTSMVEKLNTQFAGRAIFAGVGSDSSALSDAGAMLDALRAAVSGAGTAADVLATVDAWFSPGGEYNTFMNPGAETPLADISVSADRKATLDTTVSSRAVRDVLRGMAAAALVDEGLLPAQPDEQRHLARAAGEMLLSAREGLVVAQARIGQAQEQIDLASTEIAAERDAMTLALAKLLDVDTSEAATELQQVEAQIELLYMLTARAANMKLTDYL
ncbi:flagellin [Tropicimonas sp.]|uniref:flagellin n=1 Tax=Tropicimonas sp. TaxID=2067044 RepID=UPI003A869D2F